jgi:hypothetical protein
MPRKTLPRAELKCPACGATAGYVRDPRGRDDGARITRTRVCSGCGHRRGTTELPNYPETPAEEAAILAFARRALAARATKAA